MLVSTRDPGSGNALLPVLKKLSSDQGIQIDVLTDGRAQELIQNNFQTENITPENMILGSDNVIGTPRVILMDKSSEMGIDTYVTTTFPDVPRILVEDYYTNTTQYLSALKERNLPPPEKICVMDNGAKELIIKEFPELEDIIVVTGQPAFDKFINENTEQLAHEVKQKLGLQTTDKLVSFMSTMDEPEKIKKIAKSLKESAGDFYLAFRRHPRDNVSYETFKYILTDAGIKVIDTNQFSTNDIGAASDVVLTTWSTEGLHGIYRRKPTVHIIDRNYRVPESINFPLPPVQLGASVGIDTVDKIATVLPQLLDSKSVLNKKLHKNMEEQYPADGKNAERVANVVRQYLI
ncbi:MAG: hypothetical protein COU30_02345 [Candidatus Magasanikbacteria bacterium CG10_big_fil_rev_8_21_14_0_10_38_6]|uniref:UDP-N-acetylglucosamine 2-epimerase domain-containing protein n=1 Tax=Candidatus Magasanikbacteria bacterium CG10_big_fil_rev_8_21_14_0_10_38_6 TaxID=1974647 RepID=A0A2M6P169_9BACT|nr:MAG: hypothetical protein COU30_02345 [Candidatus Magasanikbacteria bacterium CG10_big_fil_rev_8_21_14_0_10_38_6]